MSHRRPDMYRWVNATSGTTGPATRATGPLFDKLRGDHTIDRALELQPGQHDRRQRAAARAAAADARPRYLARAERSRAKPWSLRGGLERQPPAFNAIFFRTSSTARRHRRHRVADPDPHRDAATRPPGRESRPSRPLPLPKRRRHAARPGAMVNCSPCSARNPEQYQRLACDATHAFPRHRKMRIFFASASPSLICV